MQPKCFVGLISLSALVISVPQPLLDRGAAAEASSLAVTATAATSTPTRAEAAALGSRVASVNASLLRISQFNSRYNAVLPSSLAATALVQAQALDTTIGAGSAGPLDRWTIAVKANIDLVERRGDAASGERPRASSPGDAFAVERVRSAGGLITAVTTMDPWARGISTAGSRFGSTGNAYDPKRSPFGSSGGSAVAVATGMVDAALGTDTCGSIRYPASANGVFGLRPTHGGVSLRGVVPLAPSQDVVGPIARSVEDLATLFRVLSVYDHMDPRSRPGPGQPSVPTGEASVTSAGLPSVSSQADRASTATPVRVPPILRMRVGVVRGMGALDHSTNAPLTKLAQSGVDLTTVSLAGLGPSSVIADEFVPARARWRKGSDSLTDDLAVGDRSGYRSRRSAQQRLRLQLVAILDRDNLDAIVYPTTSSPPGRRGALQRTSNCWVSANSGLPALAVPGRVVNNFPTIGIDLLGRSFDEETLFAIAALASPDRRSPTLD